MGRWTFATLVVGFAVAVGGLYNWAKSLQHLAPEARDQVVRVVWLGSFAGRYYFTEQGWSYRMRALGFGLAWMVWWLIWVFRS